MLFFCLFYSYIKREETYLIMQISFICSPVY